MNRYLDNYKHLISSHYRELQRRTHNKQQWRHAQNQNPLYELKNPKLKPENHSKTTNYSQVNAYSTTSVRCSTSLESSPCFPSPRTPCEWSVPT